MPATVIGFSSVFGKTGKVTIYPDGSDTASESPIDFTEATNRSGVYSFSNPTIEGLCLLYFIATGQTKPFATGWATLATSGTVQVYESREAAMNIRVQGILAGTGDDDLAQSELGGTVGGAGYNNGSMSQQAGQEQRAAILAAVGETLQAEDYTVPPTVEEIAAGITFPDAPDSVEVSGFTAEAIEQLHPSIQVTNGITISGATRHIEITTGDEISFALGNSIPINMTGSFPADISGWTANLFVVRKGIVIQGTYTVTSSSTTAISGRAEFAASETIKLAGVDGDGEAQLRFFASGDPVTPLRRIKCSIVKGLSV